MILNCDSEAGAKILQDAVIASQLGAEVELQGPLVGDHRGNGLSEVAVREVRKHCRAFRSEAEMKVGKKIQDDHPFLAGSHDSQVR